MTPLVRCLLVALAVVAIGMACGPSEVPAQGTLPVAVTPTITTVDTPTATPVPGANKYEGQATPKVSSDLLNLYQEYQSYAQQSSNDPGFEPSNPRVPVVGDRVIIDAVASGDANALKEDLEDLGLQAGAVYGSIVSGQFPISSIDSLSGLESLKSVRPAYSSTDSGSVTTQASRL